jgi:malonyl-CoA O-methyltransferase
MFELQTLAKSFTRAASTYDKVAILQREAGQNLFNRLELINMQPKTVLDLGAGTGYFSRQLEQRYPQARIITLDLALGMVQQAKKKSRWFTHQDFVCGQALHLPLADHSIDLIYSNLVLHWSHDSKAVFQEIKRVLRPDGLLTFSVMGPDTLKELRESWAKVNNHPHVHTFKDMHDIGDELMAARFNDPVIDMEMITLLYTDVVQLMRDLKALGTNLLTSRHRGLSGKRQLQAMISYYEAYRNEKKLLPVTYELVYGHAWGSHDRPNKQGAVEVPLSQLRLRKKDE